MRHINTDLKSIIRFVGLGKLGLLLATCLAKSGAQILGIYSNLKEICMLNNGKEPFYVANLRTKGGL